MDFDELMVKDNPGLCRCCLSEGCYKDLSTEYTWMNDTEVYADMLLECFDISISQHNDGPNGASRLICEVCITRLRDACNFKKQVLDSETRFIDMLAKGEFQSRVLLYQPMKAEGGEMEDAPADELEGEAEYLEEGMEFDGEDDLPLRPQQAEDQAEPSSSNAATITIVKGKRGRPKNSTSSPVKSEKKPKMPKLEEKPRSSKGANQLSATKRNRLTKRNAIILLENSDVLPFKWHRQDYLCFFCHKTFKDVDLLKEHSRNEHESSSIKSAVSYLRRDEKVKIDVSNLQCKLCTNGFDTLDSFIDHLKSAHGKVFTEFGHGVVPYKLTNDFFQCAVCSEQFQYFTKLNQHMNHHFGTYVCELCGRSFLSRDRLRGHSLSHGSNFKCTKCPEMFESLIQRNNHEAEIHSINKQLKCLYCPETFSNYRQRQKHHSLRHNIEIPEFRCQYCGKVFQIKSRMSIHVKEVHIREKNFSCNICEQKFFSRTHLQKHMVKHFGDKIHQCDVCKKSYARKQTLKDHMKIHSNERKYVCTICEQGFVQNNSLKLHMRVHHADVIDK